MKRSACFIRLGSSHGSREGRPNRALADYIAPKSGERMDFIGAFAVSVQPGTLDLATAFREAQDDYNAIMVSALSDRLTEAFAERLA